MKVGDKVRDARPHHNGREGAIVWMSSREFAVAGRGAAGDILVKVRGDDGSEWDAYERQLVMIAGVN